MIPPPDFSNTESYIYSDLIGVRSRQVRRLVQFLAYAKEGDLIGYYQLSKVAEVISIQEERHFLDAARKILQAEYSILFRCIFNKGLVRLKNSEVSKYSNVTHSKRFQRDNVRYADKIACVDPGQLRTPEHQREYYVAIAHVNIRNSLASPMFDKAIRRDLAQSPERTIDRNEMLEHLRRFG